MFVYAVLVDWNFYQVFIQFFLEASIIIIIFCLFIYANIYSLHSSRQRFSERFEKILRRQCSLSRLEILKKPTEVYHSQRFGYHRPSPHPRWNFAISIFRMICFSMIDKCWLMEFSFFSMALLERNVSVQFFKRMKQFVVYCCVYHTRWIISILILRKN